MTGYADLLGLYEQGLFQTIKIFIFALLSVSYGISG
jgi:hypothetical protein